MNGAFQVSCQLNGVEEIQHIKMRRSSGEESVKMTKLGAKRKRSVQKGENFGKRRRARAMSEGNDVVGLEKPGVEPAKKTTIQGGAGEVEAVEVNQGIILGEGCGDFGCRDGWEKGGEGGAGTVLTRQPVTSLPSKNPKKAVSHLVSRGTRSQTDPGRRSSRVEKNGREGWWLRTFTDLLTENLIFQSIKVCVWSEC